MQKEAISLHNIFLVYGENICWSEVGWRLTDPLTSLSMATLMKLVWVIWIYLAILDVFYVHVWAAEVFVYWNTPSDESLTCSCSVIEMIDRYPPKIVRSVLAINNAFVTLTKFSFSDGWSMFCRLIWFDATERLAFHFWPAPGGQWEWATNPGLMQLESSVEEHMERLLQLMSLWWHSCNSKLAVTCHLVFMSSQSDCLIAAWKTRNVGWKIVRTCDHDRRI